MPGFFTSVALTLFFLLGGGTPSGQRHIPCYDKFFGPRDWNVQASDSLTQLRTECLAKFPASMQAGFDCEKMRELSWLLSNDIDLLIFVRMLQKNQDKDFAQTGLKKAVQYLSEDKEYIISVQEGYRLSMSKVPSRLHAPKKSVSETLHKKLESSEIMIKNAEIKVNQRLQEEATNPTTFMERYAQRISDLDYQLDQLQQIQRLIEDGKTARANKSLKSLEGRLEANLQKHDFKQNPHRNEYGVIESR